MRPPKIAINRSRECVQPSTSCVSGNGRRCPSCTVLQAMTQQENRHHDTRSWPHGPAWISLPGNTLLLVHPSLLKAFESVLAQSLDSLRVPYGARLNRRHWPDWVIPAGGMSTMSSSVGQCTNAAVMSNNPTCLTLFMFLLAANAHNARATGRGAVPEKKKIVTFSVRDLLCHKPGFHSVSHYVLQHTFVRESSSTWNTLWPCMCLSEFLGACLSHSIVARRFSRSAPVSAIHISFIKSS